MREIMSSLPIAAAPAIKLTSRKWTGNVLVSKSSSVIIDSTISPNLSFPIDKISTTGSEEAEADSPVSEEGDAPAEDADEASPEEETAPEEAETAPEEEDSSSKEEEG